jgi:hypothetical protein
MLGCGSSLQLVVGLGTGAPAGDGHQWSAAASFSTHLVGGAGVDDVRNMGDGHAALCNVGGKNHLAAAATDISLS